MQKTFLLLGAFLAFTAVAAGAFGAHALKQKLQPDMLNAFEVGVRYQMYHALGLILIAVLYSSYHNGLMLASGWTLVAGTCIFSGSLYALAILGIRSLGVITPIGGVFLLIGWVLFAWAVAKS
ncbi:MAG: DUF423 domain-containing protein [Parachlamydiaceae bacterium]|nr:DUF423 domain-containing protein [Parachlamydiaceae bacterium]